MKKQLITVDNLSEYTCRTSNRIYVDNTMILTPGAKDELSKKGIDIVRTPCPDMDTCTAHSSPAAADSGACQEAERLIYGLAAMLQSEYGITDPEKLKALSIKAATIIRKNI